MRVQTFAIAATAIVALLGACQTDSPKDSMGASIEFSAWQDMKPQDADFNIAGNLPAGMLARAEKRMRNNALSNNRFVLSGPGGTGSIDTEYIAAGGFYNITVNDKILSKAKFVEDIEKNFGKTYEVFPIHWRSNVSGYGAVVTTASRSCYVATTGYKFNDGRYDNDRGNFDTTVRTMYCGPKVSPEDFRAVFANMARNRK